ncbi:MAG: glycosyltransferase family 4 protein [Patescibacteria group bacterium]
MKIALMVRGFLQTPVPNDIAYSPAKVAKSIAEGLTKSGHEVTFFGPEGTKLDVTAIETCGLRPLATEMAEFDSKVSTTDLFQDYRFSLYDTLMARTMLERSNAGEFDCVVFNHFESVLPLAPLFPKVPIVYILHDFMDEERKEAIAMHHSPNQYFISISNNQRRNAPDLNYAATVYNGISSDFFAYEENAEDYLMYSGRITPSKGVKEAVQAAIQSNRRLFIAGSLSKQDYWYFDENVKPFLNDKILFLGMLDKEQIIKYYQKAAAILVPVQWEEPFGLTMAEANACGTPVIAFNRGAVPEVIKNNKTGFIVDNSAEMIVAIGKLSKIKRHDCHDHAKRHFKDTRMVKDYDVALQDIVTKHAAQLASESVKSPSLAKSIKGLSKRLIIEPSKRLRKKPSTKK